MTITLLAKRYSTYDNHSQNDPPLTPDFAASYPNCYLKPPGRPMVCRTKLIKWWKIRQLKLLRTCLYQWIHCGE